MLLYCFIVINMKMEYSVEAGLSRLKGTILKDGTMELSAITIYIPKECMASEKKFHFEQDSGFHFNQYHRQTLQSECGFRYSKTINISGVCGFPLMAHGRLCQVASSPSSLTRSVYYTLETLTVNQKADCLG